MNGINCLVFTYNGSGNKLLLTQFEPNQDNHQNIRIIYEPIVNPNLIQERLDQIPGESDHSVIRKMFGDILGLAFNMIPILNNNNGFDNKKMAVMVTNCTLNLGTNLHELSDEFIKREVVLYIVATETPDYNIWNHYRTLARVTGGECMLLQNAPDILQQVVSSVIYQGYTFRQASQHIHVANVDAVPNNLDGTNEQSQTADGVAN